MVSRSVWSYGQRESVLPLGKLMLMVADEVWRIPPVEFKKTVLIGIEAPRLNLSLNVLPLKLGQTCFAP